MPARVLVASHLILLVAAAAPAAPRIQAPPAEAGPATVALVATWPDGRATGQLTSPRRASMWTPRFPRVEGYQPPDGARPVYAVQFTRVLVGQDIEVDVAVLLGSPEPPAVHVATVLVSPGARVVVDGLTKFGVQPVTLSLVAVGPMTPFPPTVVSVSPQIDVAGVEVLTAPYPGYRVTLRNLGDKAVANVHVQAYRGSEKTASTLKRTNDGRPMMQPGASYTFDLTLTSGGETDVAADGTFEPRPIDRIELDSVRWADGTHHGTPPFPQMESAIESRSGQRLQLQRVVEVLQRTLAERGSIPDLLAAAATRLAALPDAEADQLQAAQVAMRTTKAAALVDVQRLAHDQATPMDTRTTVDGLTAMLARYEAWLRRLSPP